MILEFSRIDTLEGVTRTWICGNRRIVWLAHSVLQNIAEQPSSELFAKRNIKASLQQ
jgi:hypothetical protein